MRKRSAIVLAVAGTALVASFAARQRRGQRPPESVTGTFSNGMRFARVGTGAKSLMWIPDPGHAGHAGIYLKLMTRLFRPFVEDGYTVFLVSHKPKLPEGATVPDLAEDYATLIADDFDGRVDLVVGDDGGGMIGFCLAARHPDLFGHIAVTAAGYTMPEATRAVNLQSARLLSAGRRTEAAEVMVRFLFPEIGAPWVARLLTSVVARVSFPASYDRGDVLVAAQAVNSFDGSDILPSIRVPVLLAYGDKDRFVDREVYERTVGLIPDCTPRLYKGKDHLGAMFDNRFPRDVLEFARRQRSAAAA